MHTTQNPINLGAGGRAGQGSHHTMCSLVPVLSLHCMHGLIGVITKKGWSQ